MVVDWFLDYFPDAKDVGEEKKNADHGVQERSGIVHRLDRDTSGVMVLAKTKEMFEYLKTQFQDRRVYKEYRAFIYGQLREKWGMIDRKIGRSARDFRLRSAQRGAKGTLREALTNWEVIGTGMYQGEHFSYVKLIPKTGRMHQLRVHMKAIDKPIVGDVLYAGAKLTQSSNLELSRLALHAHKLTFNLPDGEECRFIAPVPQEFEDAAERIAEN
jgi:23S rRNA pseudouridine1911/1915/1917 synthase